MTNAKSTKRALVSSALAILMCVAMLIGTTFAWFTDTASTGVNKIQAGNLKMEVLYRTSADGEWALLDEATDLFGDESALYEPGYTRVVEFKVRNSGNLAFKYKVAMNVISETAGVNKDGNPYKLSDYLKVATTAVQAYNPDDQISAVMESLLFVREDYGMWTPCNFADFSLEKSKNGEFLSLTPDKEVFFGMKVYMPETVGNEANAISAEKAASTNFGLNFAATQYTVESDSYGSTYDKDATYMMYPAGVTEASFDEAASVKVSTRDYATGEFITKEDTTKPAVAAYVDSKGETQYAADIKAAVLDGATVIYCKKDANMRVDFDGIRTEALTNDLTIYANGADFNYGEIALNASTPGANTDSGDLNIKVYNAKNIKIWGNTPADGVTWNIEMVNCHNVGNGLTGNNGEMILLWGDTGTVNATITNCSVAKADLGIYFGCNGSLTVKDSEFTECATGIKTSYKGTGTRTDRIENCVFTNCGCTEEMAGTGSTAYLAEDSAAYKYKNSNTGTLTLTTKGNTITGTIGNKGDTQIVGTVTLIEE